MERLGTMEQQQAVWHDLGTQNMYHLLSKLLHENERARFLYQEAAKRFHTPALCHALHRFANLREDHLRELNAHLEYLRTQLLDYSLMPIPDPCQSQNLSHDLNRCRNELELLEYCRYVEHKTMLCYEGVMEHSLPANLQQMVQYQYEQLMDSNRDLRLLRSAFA